MYPYVMDRHNDLLLGLMILTDFHRCNFVCMYPYVMDRHNDLLLGLMILTDFHVDLTLDVFGQNVAAEIDKAEVTAEPNLCTALLMFL